LYHSTLGLRAITKRERRHLGGFGGGDLPPEADQAMSRSGYEGPMDYPPSRYSQPPLVLRCAEWGGTSAHLVKVISWRQVDNQTRKRGLIKYVSTYIFNCIDIHVSTYIFNMYQHTYLITAGRHLGGFGEGDLPSQPRASDVQLLSGGYEASGRDDPQVMRYQGEGYSSSC